MLYTVNGTTGPVGVHVLARVVRPALREGLEPSEDSPLAVAVAVVVVPPVSEAAIDFALMGGLEDQVHAPAVLDSLERVVNPVS